MASQLCRLREMEEAHPSLYLWSRIITVGLMIGTSFGYLGLLEVASMRSNLLYVFSVAATLFNLLQIPLLHKYGPCLVYLTALCVIVTILTRDPIVGDLLPWLPFDITVASLVIFCLPRLRDKIRHCIHGDGEPDVEANRPGAPGMRRDHSSQSQRSRHRSSRLQPPQLQQQQLQQETRLRPSMLLADICPDENIALLHQHSDEDADDSLTEDASREPIPEPAFTSPDTLLYPQLSAISLGQSPHHVAKANRPPQDTHHGLYSDPSISLGSEMEMPSDASSGAHAALRLAGRNRRIISIASNILHPGPSRRQQEINALPLRPHGNILVNGSGYGVGDESSTYEGAGTVLSNLAAGGVVFSTKTAGTTRTTAVESNSA